jgi:hypothetical protein
VGVAPDEDAEVLDDDAGVATVLQDLFVGGGDGVVDGQDRRRWHDPAAGLDHGEHRHSQVRGSEGSTGEGEGAGEELVASVQPLDDVEEQLSGLAELVEGPAQHPQVGGQGFGVGEAAE